MKIHGKKKWGSLTDLKNYIKNSVKTEKVISFNGFELITDKNSYKMDYDGLIIEPIKK
jgi:hypothetical protein